MASYNAIIGFQTLIDRVEPFFKKHGFTFHIPPYESWLNQEVDEAFYSDRGWKNYLERDTNYKWFEQSGEKYDSYSDSGYFYRKNRGVREFIQLHLSSKKTIIPVFGIDIPEINLELNRLARKTPLCKRVYFPFSTIYHDMLWSTWTGGTADVDDVFLSYRSDKKMLESLEKIYSIYNFKMGDFFKRGISEQLLDELVNCRIFDPGYRKKVATLEYEEHFFWAYYLARKYDWDPDKIFESIKGQIQQGKWNTNYKDYLLSVNKRIISEYKES